MTPLAQQMHRTVMRLQWRDEIRSWWPSRVLRTAWCRVTGRHVLACVIDTRGRQIATYCPACRLRTPYEGQR